MRRTVTDFTAALHALRENRDLCDTFARGEVFSRSGATPWTWERANMN